jgi:hypothetical protein
MFGVERSFKRFRQPRYALYRRRFLCRCAFMRLRRLCLAIFALRLFLREPIQISKFASADSTTEFGGLQLSSFCWSNRLGIVFEVIWIHIESFCPPTGTDGIEQLNGVGRDMDIPVIAEEKSRITC